MIIFNKKFEDINFQDIENLVSNRIGESEVLDYKRDFNSREAVKLISAFANTYGGFIIYGVECNKDTNEPKRITKIEDKKLDDTIDSVCYANISPPVFCESKYLYNAKKSKKVFIVKVPESDLTPHAIDNNTTVYIKVKGQKRPLLEKADLGKQEWLKDRRTKSEDFRNLLMRAADNRIISQTASANAEQSLVTIKLIPKFPKSELVKHNLFREKVDSFFRLFQDQIPRTLITRGKIKHYNRGLCSLFNDSIREIYVDFNCFGLGVYRILQEKMNEDKEYVSLEALGNTVYTGLTFLLSFLKYIGFEGSCLIYVGLSRLLEIKLDTSYDDGATFATLQGARTLIDGELCEEYEVAQGPIEASIEQIMTDFFGNLAHLFGAQDDTYQIGSYVHRRASESYDKLRRGNGKESKSSVSQARS